MAMLEKIKEEQRLQEEKQKKIKKRKKKRELEVKRKKMILQKRNSSYFTYCSDSSESGNWQVNKTMHNLGFLVSEKKMDSIEKDSGGGVVENILSRSKTQVLVNNVQRLAELKSLQLQTKEKQKNYIKSLEQLFNNGQIDNA